MNGILYGQHPNPPQFRNFDNSGQYSSSRLEYRRSYDSVKTIPIKKKQLASKNASLHILKLKSKEIGSNTITNKGLLTFKSYDPNLTNAKLKSVRNQSCIVPPKASYQYLTIKPYQKINLHTFV